MKTIDGDLIKLALAGEFDIIIHGCNCQCVMGTGIAKSIRKAFPEAFEADRATTKGDKTKLGTISHATLLRSTHEITVVNGYTQFHYLGFGRLVDYDAVRSVMQAVKRQFGNQRLGYPLIGAGLAKGDWQIIADIIDAELAGCDHTLVRYKP